MNNKLFNLKINQNKIKKKTRKKNNKIMIKIYKMIIKNRKSIYKKN